ncbi:MAG: hypothetical protein KAI81_02660, partial [Candidatus Marinimicrobia bacterium]|nr:hypothetical protein [Candidatus Neomarinimicrobiota bacterium]
MNVKNNPMDDIVSKIEEMRGFFKVGDEVIPFLADLFSFLKDVMPLITEVNTSLKDGAHKLPTASDRLADVNAATEMATNEILDKLDEINNKVNEIRPGVDEENGKKIDDIEGTIMDIIFALQFQDITSQKLEHATRILDAIFIKFSGLFETIQTMKSNSSFGAKVAEALDTIDDSDEVKKKREEF